MFTAADRHDAVAIAIEERAVARSPRCLASSPPCRAPRCRSSRTRWSASPRCAANRPPRRPPTCCQCCRAPANDLHALTTTLEYGVACGADVECSSGVCAQGVCCNRACDGTASRCDLKDTLGTCTPLTAACTSPTRLKGADGTDTDCAPYLCQAGACLQKCATSSECAGGFICDTATSHCTAPATAEDSGGCAVSTENGTRAELWVSALVIASAFVARRRRSSRTR